jgi:hypothetical protein
MTTRMIVPLNAFARNQRPPLVVELAQSHRRATAAPLVPGNLTLGPWAFGAIRPAKFWPGRLLPGRKRYHYQTNVKSSEHFHDCRKARVCLPPKGSIEAFTTHPRKLRKRSNVLGSHHGLDGLQYSDRGAFIKCFREIGGNYWRVFAVNFWIKLFCFGHPIRSTATAIKM